MCGDFESPSLTAKKKKKMELLETTAANVERLKERMMSDIRGGKQKEPSLPPQAPLRLEF